MEDAGAVLEAPVETTEVTTDEPSQSLPDGEPGTPKVNQEEKPDGRKQPDALRKRIAELRRQADAINDPVAKKALLDDAKALNDTVGKARAYESEFPTVREAREFKALLTSVGGRDGFVQLQSVAQNAQEIDALLERGDPSVVKPMWDEAPQGMPKLMPAMLDQFEKAAPQDYEKVIGPHAVKYLDKSGFPEAFDQMASLYAAGKLEDADKLRKQLVAWVVGQRKGAETQKTDPEVERLRSELEKEREGNQSKAVDEAYNSVVSHAGPVIDKYLKPIVAKLGLNSEQYALLREDVWSDLQKTRNADPTYKTVASAKHRQGIGVAAEYIKSETEARAEAASRKVAQLRYGHQLRNGAVQKPNPLSAPGQGPGVQKGKEPSPSEIDYGMKGLQLARKMGFKDVADMILTGKAPLKAGGIRQWR